MRYFYRWVLLLCSILMLSSGAYAGILASTTRVIYTENDREQSLMLVNTNDYPIFTQVWVDDGSSNADFKNPPFLVLPPVFQMVPEEVKGLRILYNGTPLPLDRESIYWLNLYEIPAVNKVSLDQSYLNLAMNTQMKIFFRPKALKAMSRDQINDQLQFSLIQDKTGSVQIKLNNPTAYYVTAINLSLSKNATQKAVYTLLSIMLSPFQQQLLSLANTKIDFADNYTIKYLLIDDMGNTHLFEKKLKMESITTE